MTPTSERKELEESRTKLAKVQAVCESVRDFPDVMGGERGAVVAAVKRMAKQLLDIVESGSGEGR